MDDLEAEAAVGEREDLVGGGRPAEVTPGVGDHDDLELEPFRSMDREQPDGVGTLLLRDASSCAAPSASWSRRKPTKPSMSRPRTSS